MTTDLGLIDAICRSHDRGEVDDRQFLTELPAFVARAIGCSRAGVRVVIEAPNGCVLRTIAMYEQSVARLVDVSDLTGEGVRPYLESLGRQGGIVAAEVALSPCVARLLRHYDGRRHVRSLMDVGIDVRGTLHGVLTCEQLRTPQLWSPRQLLLLRHISGRVGPRLASLLAEHAAAPRPRAEDDAVIAGERTGSGDT
jgi:GAF domain-containing protein